VVAVALLGQEQLPLRGELLLLRVAGDDGVEQAPRSFGAQDAAQALGLLLARAERAGDLNRDVGVGQVDGEVRDLAHDEPLDLAARNRRTALRARAAA
jgi:hypothetical protein